MKFPSDGLGNILVFLSKMTLFPTKIVCTNLQTVRAKQPNGAVKRVTVCTSCIKAGKVQKA